MIAVAVDPRFTLELDEVRPPARGETSDSEDRPDGVDTYRF